MNGDAYTNVLISVGVHGVAGGERLTKGRITTLIQVVFEDTIRILSVSYTHLTLPTKRIV